MFCIECGTKLEANQKFCKNCGSPIKIPKETKKPSTTSNERTAVNNSPKSSSKKNYIFYSLGFGLLIILISAPVWGLAYAIGYALPYVLILLGASSIPNKNFRKVLMALLSFIFLVIVFVS